MNLRNQLNNFTVHKNKTIDNRILEDLQTISKILFCSLDEILGIYLVGGFGRGEGSILYLENKVYIINDYDLVVITDKLPTEILKKKIIDQIKEKILIKQVDITYYKFKSLKNLKKTVYNYDLKFFSKVIYEKNNYLDNIPIYNNKFSTSEANLPLEVYMSALLLSFHLNDDYKNLTLEDKFWTYHQITKSILGWSMAELIKLKKYKTSYSMRLKEYQKIYKEDKFNYKYIQIKKATDFKLNTHLKIDSDVQAFWLECKEIHINMLIKYFFYSEFLKLKFPFFFIKFKPKNLLKYFYGIFFKKKYYIEHCDLFLAKLYFLLSIKRNEVNKDYLNKSLIYAKKIGFIDKKSDIASQLIKFLKNKDPNCLQFYETKQKIINEKK